MRNLGNGFLVVLSLMASSAVVGIALAAQVGPHDYSDWKNHPPERFSDAETNFKKAKQMLLDQYYDTQLTDERLYQAATDGMLRALNKDGNDGEAWNKLITPTELKELQDDLKGEVTGIGVEIKFESGTGISSVIGLIPGSVAEKAGVRVGDQIISVNGKLYKGLQFRDVVYEIRGMVGERVKLKILRGDSLVTKEVMREKIAWSPVDSMMLEKKVGLVSIRYFNETTSRLLREAMERLKGDGVRSLIVDLRGNSGGLFEKAIEAAGYLLPKGSVVVRVDARGSKQESVKTTNEPVIHGVAVAVLVDDETSSGAELFAASLVDNLGAKLVGTKTHGKWSAQTIESLPNRFAIKFTTKIFKSPKNRTYQDVGMEPDILVTGEGKDAKPMSKDPQKKLASDAPLRAAYNLLSSA